MAFDDHNFRNSSRRVELRLPFRHRTTTLEGLLHRDLATGLDLRPYNLSRHSNRVRRALRPNDHRVDVAQARHRVGLGFEGALNHRDNAAGAARQQ
jgi:hypothetical protein